MSSQEYCVVYRGEIIFYGDKKDCYYYGSGLPNNEWSVIRTASFEDFKAVYDTDFDSMGLQTV